MVIEMNTKLMANMLNGLYKLNKNGKGSWELYEAMDYDHWVYMMEQDKVVGLIKCTYAKKSDKTKILNSLSSEVVKFVKTTTESQWQHLYDLSWDLWNKEYLG